MLHHQPVLRIGAAIDWEDVADPPNPFTVVGWLDSEPLGDFPFGEFGPSFGNSKAWHSAARVQLVVSPVASDGEVIECLRAYVAEIEANGLPEPRPHES